MTRKWWAIAKAEFLVGTSRYKGKRTGAAVLFFIIGCVWAFYLVPLILSSVFGAIGIDLNAFFAVLLPGAMRSAVLIIWMMLFIYPIIYSLREISIGQWEIILSNNVSTRSMVVGMFIGKIPTYGLLVLYLAPILMTPFIMAYQVTLLGQVIIYLMIYLIAISTLWISNLVSLAIQAKLGDSPRANDLAKALSMLFAVFFLIPLYSLIYFADAISSIMGLNAFLFLPPTWGADLITWVTVIFNGKELNVAAIIAGFSSSLGMGVIPEASVLSVFILVTVGGGVLAADRLFSIGTSSGASKRMTVTGDNIALRGLRRIMPGSFGMRLTISMKEFGRKTENLAKMLYGIFLAILLPLMIRVAGLEQIPDPLMRLLILGFILSLIIGILGGVTFGGTGILDSRDQLWIIKSAPHGVPKFIKARIAQSLIFAVPMALAPAIIVSYFAGLDVVGYLYLIGVAYSIVASAILIGIGITAMNPNYEDTKSSAFQVISGLSTIIIVITAIASLTFALYVNAVSGGLLVLGIANVGPILILGVLICLAGTLRLGSTDMV